MPSFFFVRDVQSLYLRHACMRRLRFLYECLHMSTCTCVFHLLVHAFTMRPCVCVCALWHNTAVLSAWLTIFSVHSPLLSLSPPPPPPSPSPPPPSQPRSARLARTCMSVDSVLCLLPWHAPTSLQCSPVCINWQRDSGYVVRRVDRKKQEEARRQYKDTVVTISDGRTDGRTVFTEGQTDKQRECVLLSVHRHYLTVCYCVCVRAGRVCICLFASVCVWICVSCVWLHSSCVLTHVCLYVPCRYRTLLKQSSLNQSLTHCIQHVSCFHCDWKVKVYSVKHNFLHLVFLWWKFYWFIYLSGWCALYCRLPKCGAQIRELPPLLYTLTCKDHTTFTCMCACAHRVNMRSVTAVFHSSPPTHIRLEVILSLNCCLLSFIACHRLWHLAPVLPRSHQTTFREAVRVLAKSRKHRNVTWISWATAAEA